LSIRSGVDLAYDFLARARERSKLAPLNREIDTGPSLVADFTGQAYLPLIDQ
jgi:hypothetical protein